MSICHRDDIDVAGCRCALVNLCAALDARARRVIDDEHVDRSGNADLVAGGAAGDGGIRIDQVGKAEINARTLNRFDGTNNRAQREVIREQRACIEVDVADSVDVGARCDNGAGFITRLQYRDRDSAGVLF